MLKSIAQALVDYPALCLIPIGAFVLMIVIAVISCAREERRNDENLPSYMKVYDRHGKEIKKCRRKK